MRVFFGSFACVEGERCGGGFERVYLEEGLAWAGKMGERGNRRWEGERRRGTHRRTRDAGTFLDGTFRANLDIS